MTTTQATVRRWWHRGSANHGWLRSFFTFSFANYYDPSFTSFSNLRVINEDRVSPQTGFPTHPHANAEIFSYIISGELTHKDSMGNIETLKRGEVQFTSAGKGIRHSEYNNHPSKECHFLQIWYTPNERDLPPKYYTIPQVPDEEKTDKFLTLIRDVKTFTPDELKLTGLLPKGRAIPAHSSLTTRVCILTPGQQVTHSLGSESIQEEGERWAYLHMAMTSGYKSPDGFEARVRKDITGYSKHEDQLSHAARFCNQVYGSDTKKKITSVKGKQPRVTLTFAQSKDGKIAGPGKKMVALSNAESMIMTHSLRTVHEGILVGIGTLINDNPQLNARLLNPVQGGKEVALETLPRPIILDSKLRTPLTCKLLINLKAGVGKAPLIITAKGSDAEKAQELRNAGAEIVEVDSKDGLLPWDQVLERIFEAGIKSVMVEGGATIIESLFAAHEEANTIDELIITVAPVKLGEEGLSYKRPNWLSQSLNLPPTNKKATSTFSKELYPVNLQPDFFSKDIVHSWSSQSSTSEARIKVQGQILEEGDGIFIRKGKVGDEIVVENIGQRNAEMIVFEVPKSESNDDDD